MYWLSINNLMFKYRHGPRPFVSLFLCCTVIGGDFDFVFFCISIHLLADSSPLFINLFLLYVVRHVWG